MPEIIGTITRAEPRFIERRDGTGSFPLYEVWIDGQGPWVARKDVFNQAKGLEGFRAQAIVRDEQKGDFLNHYLDFVAPAGSSPVPAQPNPAVQAQQAQYQGVDPAQAAQAVARGQAQYAPQPTTAAQVLAQPNPTEERRQQSIERQKASDVAATLANLSGDTSPLTYWENVQALTRFYATGESPLLPLAQPVGQNSRQNAAAYQEYKSEYQQQTQNQYVPQSAYADPGSQAPPHTDDDVPF